MSEDTDFAKTSSARPVVVVTGASAGVGRATAVEFARHGWRVALIARGADRLDRARSEVEAAGGAGITITADVSDSDAIFAAADHVVQHWGKIEVWVNNAMVTVFAPVDAITPAEFRRVTEVTYLGQVHGTLAALRHMRRQGYGAIVQIGSALSYRSIPLQSAYCAAKFAVRGFTDSLRSELMHEGSRIRLTMVQLPAVNTPQFDWARSRLPHRLQPVPPIYQPEAIAKHIFAAAQSPPRELWIGVPTWKAVLGTLMLPSWLDRLMSRQAWNGQMTSETAQQHRGDNLTAPPPGDPGTRGRFDPRSSSRAMAVSGNFARVAVATLAISTALACIWMAGGRERRAALTARRELE